MSLGNVVNRIKKKAISGMLKPEIITPICEQIANEFIGFNENEKVFRIQRAENNRGPIEIAVMIFNIKGEKINTKTIEDFVYTDILTNGIGAIKIIPGIDIQELTENILTLIRSVFEDTRKYYLIGRAYFPENRVGQVEIMPVHISETSDPETGKEIFTHIPQRSIYIRDFLPDLLERSIKSGHFSLISETITDRIGQIESENDISNNVE